LFAIFAFSSVRGEDQAQAISSAIERGIAFLVLDQNPNGSWGSARETKGLNIYAPAPGAHDAFRAATTALAVSALIDSGIADQPGAATAALEKGQSFLLSELPEIRRATADAMYNVWTHAFGLTALAKMYARSDAGRQAEIVTVINGQIDRLDRYASVDGGWGYYDFRVGSARPASSSISFTTATGLVGLHDVREIPGVIIPQSLVDRAIAATLRQRKSDFSYLYGEYLNKRPVYGINRPGGSLGRSQACNYALRLWGDEKVTDAVMLEWLDRLGERNGWLDIGRKRPIPHEAWFQVAGYFYYYGHYYAGLTLEMIPPSDRPSRATMLAGLLLPLQEKDGSWWDFPFYTYHQPYGTAFAVMTLVHCR
jgi:hypothetical protein